MGNIWPLTLWIACCVFAYVEWHSSSPYPILDSMIAGGLLAIPVSIAMVPVAVIVGIVWNVATALRDYCRNPRLVLDDPRLWLFGR